MITTSISVVLIDNTMIDIDRRFWMILKDNYLSFYSQAIIKTPTILPINIIVFLFFI